LTWKKTTTKDAELRSKSNINLKIYNALWQVEARDGRGGGGA
jgi:hypothetical protein